MPAPNFHRKRFAYAEEVGETFSTGTGPFFPTFMSTSWAPYGTDIDWTVPYGVSHITCVLGGYGASKFSVQGIAVEFGDVIRVRLGGPPTGSPAIVGGYNYGGNGVTYDVPPPEGGSGGTITALGGGGRTDVFLNGNLLMVAPGGGSSADSLQPGISGLGYQGSYGSGGSTIGIFLSGPPSGPPRTYNGPSNVIGGTNGGSAQGADALIIHPDDPESEWTWVVGAGGGGWGGGHSGMLYTPGIFSRRGTGGAAGGALAVAPDDVDAAPTFVWPSGESPWAEGINIGVLSAGASEVIIDYFEPETSTPPRWYVGGGGIRVF